MEDRNLAINAIQVIEDIETKTHRKEVLAVYKKYISKFGFDSFFIGRVVNPVLTTKEAWLPLALTDWPEEWYKRWLEKGYAIHDPITQYLLKSRRPFLWSTAYAHASKYGEKITNESREFNFKDGIVFPITTGFGPLGCVSIGTDTVDLKPGDYGLLDLVAIHCYMHLEKLNGVDEGFNEVNLTKRETDVVYFVAEGKTNWEIGKILSLSQHTITEYLANISKKLNSCNRAHTVSQAIKGGFIAP